jgi:hypothetical protein
MLPSPCSLQCPNLHMIGTATFPQHHLPLALRARMVPRR